MQKRSGFTLLELSIVLLIIGVLAGGLLLGRDLIEAAAIRGQISQIDKYNAATNTFRLKYGFLPGDLPDDVASQLGSQFFARSATLGDGDGDGYIHTKGFNTTLPPGLIGETAYFWTDLSAAALIEGNFVDSLGLPVNATGESQISQHLPKARIGHANYVTVYDLDDGDLLQPKRRAHNFEIVSLQSPGRITAGRVWVCPSLTPFQAQAIDQKMDDGMPLSGRVQAMWAPTYCPDQLDMSLRLIVERAVPAFNWNVPQANCIQQTTPVTYGTANPSKANVASCSLRIRAAF